MPNAPHLWGLTVQQLYDFALEVYADGNFKRDEEDLQDGLIVAISEAIFPDPSNAPPLTMYDVVTRFVKPKCSGTNLGLGALLNRDKLKRATVFVSHSWAENFAYFVYIISRKLIGTLNMGTTKMTPEKDAQLLGFGEAGLLDPDTVIWCCALAIDQNADITAVIGDEGPMNSPFARVLQQADEVLVVHNKAVNLYARVWCVYEMYLALQTQSERLQAEQNEHVGLQLRSVGMLKDEVVEASIRFLRYEPSRAELYAKVESLFDDKEIAYLNMEHAWVATDAEKNHEKMRAFQNTVTSKLEPLLLDYVKVHPIRVREAQASVEADRLSIMQAIEGSEDAVDQAVSQTMVDALLSAISFRLRTEKWMNLF